jgi:hypothetical protein
MWRGPAVFYMIEVLSRDFVSQHGLGEMQDIWGGLLVFYRGFERQSYLPA